MNRNEGKLLERETLRKRMQQIRLKLEMNQSEFANRIKFFTQSHISNIERGESYVSDKLIEAICDYLNVNEVWFRTGKGDMFNPFSKFDGLLSDEIELIEKFRDLDRENRQAVLKYVNMLLKDQIEEQQSLAGKESPPEKADDAGASFPLEPIAPAGDLQSGFEEKRSVG